MSAPVSPIIPGLEVGAADTMHERLNRWYAEFAGKHGQPVALALVLLPADGAPVAMFRKEDGDAHAWAAYASGVLHARSKES